ncbi:hypothetical protein PHLGIDRAFT_124550 [Phlebiopsis gigantea 11061_1 CR5-6]|uniref:Uncharacterized protein n=1 Tax=Phlebiopsis gigantea (strain 11061_1 CR5-6) TaxID=745531 RepID=A0A0C3SFD5_PHLG1|nr:hypothetical protein PHLGIDRAFT_124550 [Phlebiopsis gigantea 11061_1 CR5-6]
MYVPSTNKVPTAPRALRNLLEQTTPVAVPPSGPPPPLPPKPEQGTQTPQWDSWNETTPAVHTPVKNDKESWRQRIKLLSAATTASEAHDKLQDECAQLRHSVQTERFRAHPAQMQTAILRRLAHANDAVEVGAAALDKALQQLEDSVLWLGHPRKRNEAPPGKLTQVLQLARLTREMAALRTEVAEVKTSVQELENAPAVVVVRAQADKPQVQAVGRSGETMDMEEGEIPPESALAPKNALPLEEEDLKQVIDFDPRPVPERITELEERLENLSLMIYQEQDDYKDRVDAYVEDKMAASLLRANAPATAGGSSTPLPEGTKAQKLDADLALLREQMRKYETAVVGAKKRQDVLDETNKRLQQENTYLRKQLELAEKSIPEVINVQKELEELKEKIAACQKTVSLTRGPSQEELIDAVLPTLMGRLHIANHEDLEVQRAAITQTLQENNGALLNVITPRLDLTADTLNQLLTWVTNWQEGAER